MEYEDRITIRAPEGIELDYVLAGLGSRFIAELVDLVIRLVVLGALVGVLAALGGGTLAVVALIVASFLALFAYDIVFEVWASGRTPGKRWSGLRVVMAGGQPVGLAASAVRNLLRIVDLWGTALLAGIVSILLTKQNQRLGDLAAGTIVVREHRAPRVKRPAPRQPGTEALPEAHAAGVDIDVTAVTAPELAAIRDFLARRDGLTTEARARVCKALVDGVRPKVGGPPPGELAPERLLEAIAAAKAAAR